MKSLFLSLLVVFYSFSIHGGGTGVGNSKRGMNWAAVPGTSLELEYPSGWTASVKKAALNIQDQESYITAYQVSWPDLTEPTPADVRRALKETYPGRDYRDYQVNGMMALRYDEAQGENSYSEVFVYPNPRQIVQVKAQLSKRAAFTGEKIISSLRLKYKGKPLANQRDKTAIFKEDTYYSVSQDCYYYRDCKNGRSGSLILMRSGELSVGTAGSATGKILDLGDVNYQNIRIEGEYLLVPKTKVALSDIYQAFTPEMPIKDLERAKLTPNHTYLLRTIDWPDDDTLTKFKVVSVTSTQIEIVYQKLAQVPTSELQKEIDKMNRRTLEVEMKKDSGIVTLYSRGRWGDYHSSSFNFKYATRDNFYVSHNTKHLLYTDGSNPMFHAVSVHGNMGGLIDLGPGVRLSDVNPSMFPDPNHWAIRDDRISAVVDHTYLVHYLDSEDVVQAAVRVLEIAPEAKWIRLAWRRIGITKPYHFQNWQQREVKTELKTVTLDKKPSDFSLRFCFDCEFTPKKTRDFGYEKKVEFVFHSSPYISTDNRFFDDGSSGLYYIGDSDLEKVQLGDFQKASGKYERNVDMKPGVYLLWGESYWEKNLVAFEIVSMGPNGVTIKYRHLYGAQIKPRE